MRIAANVFVSRTMIGNQGKIVKACSALYLKRTIRPPRRRSRNARPCPASLCPEAVRQQAAQPKAVRRTAIVSRGFAPGAGRFPLCGKHSLHSRTAGRRACAPTSERVPKTQRSGPKATPLNARQRISTCRPCRRRQREPQARERECPPPGTRWSAPSQPRRRRSAAQNGSPWWDR